MKAIHVTALGGPEVMKVVEVPEPEVAHGTVRVRNRAVGVNFHDVQGRRDGEAGQTPPFVPGTDFAGEVDAVGEGVEGLAKGDRVLGIHVIGAYAEKTVVPAVLVVPIPEDLAFEQAAACPVAGLTAWFLVRDLALAPGKTAVVHAAAGGVGCFLGGLVRDAGATSIGLVSSDEKAEIAERAGHAHVVNYKREDPVARVQELTGGRGADVVYDSVAGPGFAKSFEMTRVGGTVVLFGRAAGDPPPGVFESAFLGAGRNLGLRTYFLGATIQSDPLSIRPAYAALFDALRQERVRLPLETLPLERAPEAHARLESGKSIGKFVLIPG